MSTEMRNVGMIAAVLVGSLIVRTAADAQQATPARSVAATPSVVADNTASSGVARGETVRVLVRSFQLAAIGAEVNARILKMPEREGDRFAKGDVLVQFDCARISAEHDAAVATYKAQAAVFANQSQLHRYKAAGGLSVDQARFEMEKAEADVRGHAARRETCTILAPFDGRVTEKAAQAFEVAQPNQPLLKIVNDTKLELLLLVPSSWMRSVTDGAIFSVRIDETGESYPAKVIQSTGAIDPVSQSVRLIGEITVPTSRVLPGMSGTATFDKRGSAR